LERSRQVEFDLFEAAINVLTLKQADTSILELFREVKNSPRFGGLPWRGVPWRGVAVLCNPARAKKLLLEIARVRVSVKIGCSLPASAAGSARRVS